MRQVGSYVVYANLDSVVGSVDMNIRYICFVWMNVCHNSRMFIMFIFVYFFFVALTAPAFGAATTTAAAPATGFSFGSTNTGEMIFTFVAMYFSILLYGI